jgi:hypothetical protein
MACCSGCCPCFALLQVRLQLQTAAVQHLMHSARLLVPRVAPALACTSSQVQAALHHRQMVELLQAILQAFLQAAACRALAAAAGARLLALER